jgi:phosphomannomutase
VTFSAHIAPIRRYANSGECNYRVRDPDAAIAAALRAAEAFGTVVGRSEIDGVRLEWTDGWLSLRPSHTEPYLRLIVEAEDGERLARRLDVLETALAPFAEEGSVAVRGADGHA